MLTLRHIIFLCLLVQFTKVEAQNVLHLCEGSGLENFKVPVHQGSFYLWQINATSGIATITSGNGTESITVDILSIGGFSLLVTETDSNGCTGTDSMQVVVHPLPVADFAFSGNCLENPTVFMDNSYLLSDSLVNFIWYFDDGLIGAGDSTVHYYNDLGNHTVRLVVTSNFGCKDSIVRNVPIFSPPIVDFSYDPLSATIVDPIIQFTNKSIDALPIFWDFDDATFSIETNPSHSFNYPGSFEVLLIAEDSNLCVDSALHTINIFYEFLFYVPNSFTPNDDGENDIFIPKGFRMNEYKEYLFIVYNRWGEEVFRTNQIGKGWDGKDAKTDVFTWAIIITDELGAIRKQVGEVTLVR